MRATLCFIVATLAALMLAAPSTSKAIEIFGLKSGADLATLTAQVGYLEPTPDPFVYATRTAPNPHSEFSHYLLSIDPEFGLVKIVAVGRLRNTAGQGLSELNLAFTELRHDIGKKYRRAKAIEGTTGRLEVTWAKVHPSRLDRIHLEVREVDPTVAHIALTYEFPCYDELVERVRRSQRKAL
jgi:hypothetical protein